MNAESGTQDKSSEEDRQKWQGMLSHMMVYIDLFCLLVLAMSVMATRSRLLAFFEHMGYKLAPFAYTVLSLSSMEWMGLALIAGLLLILKERTSRKGLALAVNVTAFAAILLTQFAYVLAMTISLQPR